LNQKLGGRAKVSTDLAGRLRNFHQMLADRAARGEPLLDLVDTL
jgi:hypothetical protein